MTRRRFPWILWAGFGACAVAAGCSGSDDPDPNAFSQGPTRLGSSSSGEAPIDRPEGSNGGLPKPAPPKSRDGGVRSDSGALDGGGACIELEPGSFVTTRAEPGLATYSDNLEVNGLSGTLRLLFVTDAKRSEDLSSELAANFRTCEYCTDVALAVGENEQRDFFQQSGTLRVDATSTIYAGVLHATLTDVTLVEVTYDDDLNSTPVPNGACLHITRAQVDVVP